MGDEVNVTPPSDDFKVRMQDYARELTNLKYEIIKGRVRYIKDYVNTLVCLGDELEPWYPKEKPIIDDLCKEADEMEKGLNKHKVKNELQFDEYFSKLKEIEAMLRFILKRENFLVKVSERRLRLS